MRDVGLVAHLVRYEQLSFWVNRVGAAFTVGFSVIFLVLLGATAGNSRIKYLGNIKLIQYYVPGFVAYGVMAAAFTNLAIILVVRRETGLLKRLRLSPLPAWMLMVGIFVNTTIISVVQVVLLLVIGRFGYGVRPPSSIGAFVVVLLVGIASFAAMGVAMSTLIPNQDTAGPVTSIVFFVLLFLSGLWYPIKAHSALATFSSYFPVRHFLLAMSAPFGFQRGVSPWAWHDLLIVAIWGALATVVALRRFRWSPRRS
jgi:ABC-2 type transport system permease protein